MFRILLDVFMVEKWRAILAGQFPLHFAMESSELLAIADHDSLYECRGYFGDISDKQHHFHVQPLHPVTDNYLVKREAILSFVERMSSRFSNPIIQGGDILFMHVQYIQMVWFSVFAISSKLFLSPDFPAAHPLS